MRRTKIVCTLGPASSSPERLAALIDAGMDVARFNFSHGTHDEHARTLADLRRLAEQAGRPVAALLDLAGPKIRTGPLAAGPVELVHGATITLTSRDVPGDAREVGLTYPELPQHVKAGDELLLADGALELEVERSDGRDIVCRVVVGGELGEHKGINVPAGSLPVSILTDKDRDDLRFGIAQGMDAIAVSFVRTARDIDEVRKLARADGSDAPLIAKIEQREAIENIDAILAAVDGVMIARGDLGVEIPLEDVPRVQKDILGRANRAGLPAITATQMLRSMVENPRPTRAEVSDVANAVLDGTDAVMLSEETAIGEHPAGAVAVMARIAAATERDYAYDGPILQGAPAGMSPEQGVARAACLLARDIGAAAILVLTRSGSTARQVARCRPGRPVLALTTDTSTYRRLALVWGVKALTLESADDLETLEREALRRAIAAGDLAAGDTVVITAGIPLQEPGTTNLVKVARVEGD